MNAFDNPLLELPHREMLRRRGATRAQRIDALFNDLPLGELLDTDAASELVAGKVRQPRR